MTDLVISVLAIVMSLMSIRITMMTQQLNKARAWRGRHPGCICDQPAYVANEDYWRGRFWAHFFNRKAPVA